ncbi:MAG: type II toxin-antitoxin system VapC family toxin [Thermoleophilaceae bacterium]|nr:type II toxin-antitoxin system VapC family toxin [Thermoleophilaceae bacterium]
MTFVDTSSILALIDADDEHHEAAAAAFASLLPDEHLITHSYVVVETAALVHRRLGTGLVRRLLDDLVPLLETVFVAEQLHARAATAYLDTLRRRSSLVDHVSFELMRERGIRRALAFDRDFRSQGFELVG